MTYRQISMRLDGLCDVCRYPLADFGKCNNPVCGGTDAAYDRFIKAAQQRAANEAIRTESQRLVAESFRRAR